MQLDQIQVGDVLTTVRGDIVCIMNITPGRANPISLQMKVGKTYVAKPDFFVSKIGTFNPDSLKVMSTDSPQAERQPHSDFFMPPALKAMGIKVGDEVWGRHGYGEKMAIFEGYNPNRPKYPISYTLNGKKWKGPETCILRKVEK